MIRNLAFLCLVLCMWTGAIGLGFVVFASEIPVIVRVGAGFLGLFVVFAGLGIIQAEWE